MEKFFVEGRELPVLVKELQHDSDWSKASGHRIDKFAEKDAGPPTREAVHASVAEVLDALQV